jgi:Cft2 family RNA processing exonuclease
VRHKRPRATSPANCLIGMHTRIIIPTCPPTGSTARSTVQVSIWSYSCVRNDRRHKIEETAKLIIHMLSVDKKWVHPLPMDVATEIPDTGGVRVTTIDANHCPGSALFLFEGRQTAHAGDSSYKSPAVGTNKVFRYLHCGDFRANPQHVLHPAVNGKKIDTVYLDTTYLDPKVSLLPCIFSTSC